LKKPRNSNHRDKADRQKAREMANTKNENQQLRRQIARLQREVERLEFVGTVEDEGEVLEPRPVKSKQKSCQNCSKDELKEMVTPGGKIITTCLSCLHRQTT
jgi:phage host-nuclease inhibitor protein Gam